MNDPDSFERSKMNDKRIINFFNSLNRNDKSHVASEQEDMKLKIDVWLDLHGELVPVDTKYEDVRPITRMWYEADVEGRRCKKVLYCFSSAVAVVEKDGETKHKVHSGKFTRCYLVDVEWLDRHARENRDKWYPGAESGKMLVDFSVLDAAEDGCVEVVDLSEAGLA